jgi:hypothetical protein
MAMFSAPIPGQSLTDTPKNAPWERPPEITDPEEAIQMHLSRLSAPEMLKNVLDTVELHDVSIMQLTQGIVRGAVYKGIHSVDVGLIVAPVIHEFIKQATKAVGIEADDGFVDKTTKAKEDEARVALRAKRMLASMGVKAAEVAQAAEALPTTQEAAPVGEAMPTQEAAPTEAPTPSKGLMARGEM